MSNMRELSLQQYGRFLSLLKAKMVHAGKSWSGYCGNLSSKQELEVVFILDSY